MLQIIQAPVLRMPPVIMYKNWEKKQQERECWQGRDVGESVEKDFVWEEALARSGHERVCWEGDMPHPIAQGGGQLQLAFITQECWEMVNKEAQFLQYANVAEFCNMRLGPQRGHNANYFFGGWSTLQFSKDSSDLVFCGTDSKVRCPGAVLLQTLTLTLN